MNTVNKPFYHFSIDDVFKALIETSDAGTGLFQHPFFAFLRELHETFGTHVDLYLFERGVVNGRERTLADVSDRLREELAPLEWLRFGPHAQEDALPPFRQSPEQQVETFSEIYRQIDRFAGPARRSRWVRLHFFSEAYGAAPFLRAAGVQALLLTDKEAGAYHLPEPLRDTLKAQGRVPYAELELARSHHRVENLLAVARPDILEQTLAEPLSRHGFLALFTHEYELERPEVRARTLECLKQLSERAVQSV